jgi:ApaG protein
MSLVFAQTTDDITVKVIPQFLQQESEPDSGRYAWSYTVVVENSSEESVQILKRSWKIVDSNGFIQEVSGPGVVGQTPTIRPGESYEYTSMASLLTGSGMMLGAYEVCSKSGKKFSVEVPAFSLDSEFGSSLPN